MAFGNDKRRFIKGKALRLAFLFVALLAGLAVSLVFVVNAGDSPGAVHPPLQAKYGSAGTLMATASGEQPGVSAPNLENSGASGGVLLRTPDTGKEKASGASLAGGQAADIRWDQGTGTPAFVTGSITPPPRATAADSTLAFFDQNKNVFHISEPASELSLKRQEVDSLGMTHLHLAQVYQGVPVFGSDLAVHLRQGKIVAINGRYVPGIALSVKPDVSVDQAVAVAQKDLGQAVSTSKFEPPQLMVLTPGGRQALLTWKIILASDKPPLRMVYFVDAHTGQLAARYDDLEGARSRMTYTAGNGTTMPGTLLISEGGSSSDKVAQITHNNTGAVYDYYLNGYGRDSIDNAGMTITSTVHYSTSYDNAYWNGYQMVYGDGDGSIFSPLGEGLDVVAHELTHGVTQHTAGLIYSYQTGALNESYSDVLGELAEPNPDWQIGESVYTPNTPGDALRSMSNPPLYGQPDNMSNYVNTDSDNGGVHTNSGITNKAAYNVAMSIGKDKMGQIWYRALTLYLTSDAQFSDARDASVQAATDLYGANSAEVTAVEKGFAAVGIGSTQTSNMTARIEINHTYRGDLVVTLGVGDPNAPTWSDVVSNRQGGSAQNIYTTVDISGAAAYLPPAGPNHWFLKVYDASAQDTGSIQKFAVTDNGTTYTANDTPIPVNDFQTSISYIPSGDQARPTVTGTSPAANDTGVYGSARVSATFSEDVTPGTLGPASFSVKKHSDGAAVAGEISYDQSSFTATLTPAGGLTPLTAYDATITTDVTDTTGRRMAQNYQWSFTTGPPVRPYYFAWYDTASPGMGDWLVVGDPASGSAAGFDFYIGGRKANGGPVRIQPGQTQPVSYGGTRGGPVEVSSLTGSKQVVSRRTLYNNSFEEINALDGSKLDSHYYFTWYDNRSRNVQDWIMLANPGSSSAEADIYIDGQKINQTPYQIPPGGNVTPQFPGEMGGPVEVKAYDAGNPASPHQIIASQRVLWNGNFNEAAGIPASQMTSEYLYTWYDMKSPGASDWILVSNPHTTSMVAEIRIGGRLMTDSASGNQYFSVPAGGTIKPVFPGKMAGPVDVRGFDAATYNPASPGAPNMTFYTTQRSLFGTSFEEISGYAAGALAGDYNFSWYDQKSAGSQNWVLVSNPGATAVKAEVWIAGSKMATLDVAAGSSQTDTFPGVMSGPVEVRGYNAAGYNPASPGSPNASILASQRVMWSGHFNEVEGTVLGS